MAAKGAKKSAFKTYSTVFKNAFKKGFLSVMIEKIFTRIKEPSIKEQLKVASEWCQGVSMKLEDFCEKVNPQVYQEAEQFREQMMQDIAPRLAELPVDMGGGGDITLAYFLARLSRHETIVETGVSMGYTSYAFLKAIDSNGTGKLYSSDFPYFRIDNPEQYVGWVVPEEMRADWTLLIKGDRVNMPMIMDQVEHIDLFHFDSDKSYAGRQYAWEMVQPKISDSTIVVFDDIGDNEHFRKEIYDKGVPCQVLKARAGGYIGVVGEIVNRLN